MASMTVKASDIQIAVNDMTTCFDDFGKGNIPIIFIHGFPFNKSSWQPQMTYFKHKHRVIAYDIRGFGASTAGNETPSMTQFADDLVQFMNRMQIEKAIVCGLSMGGYILLNAVQRYSNRFEALILCDTQCIPDSEITRDKRKQTILDVQADGLKTFADGFIKNVFTETSLKNKNNWVKTIKDIILATPIATITGALSALAERSETCSALKEISVPTLILCGREDTVTPIAQSEVLRSEIENSVLHIIENAGHLSNLEQPEVFNKHITSFLSSLVKK
jgi:3-oxoadipate enol-lactonase